MIPDFVPLSYQLEAKESQVYGTDAPCEVDIRRVSIQNPKEATWSRQQGYTNPKLPEMYSKVKIVKLLKGGYPSKMTKDAPTSAKILEF